MNLQGGHLKDGANADGQYCWIKPGGGIRYDYDQGKAICEGLGGDLVMTKTIAVHRKLLEGKCSLLDTLWPGQNSCSMVYRKLLMGFLLTIYKYSNIVDIAT